MGLSVLFYAYHITLTTLWLDPRDYCEGTKFYLMKTNFTTLLKRDEFECPGTTLDQF